MKRIALVIALLIPSAAFAVDADRNMTTAGTPVTGCFPCDPNGDGSCSVMSWGDVGTGGGGGSSDVNLDQYGGAPVGSGNPIDTRNAAGNASLTSIDGKLPALSGGKVPVVDSVVSTNTGAPADAVCASDDGTCALIALVKRGNARLTSILGIMPAVPATGTLQGALTETAPASDTASSGLNGRLQRIAQRLTSLIALLPTSLTTHGDLKVGINDGPNAACASDPRTTLATITAGDTSEVVDTGATGTVYWIAASNLSRSWDIEIEDPGSGTTRIPPGGSVRFSMANAATPDSVTFDNGCTGCGGASTNVSVVACDDN